MKRLIASVLERSDEWCHRHRIGPPKWLCTAADISYGVPPGHHGPDKRWHTWLHRWLYGTTIDRPNASPL